MADYTERVEIRIDPALKERLSAVSKATHTKAAQIIRTALREYLAKHGKEAA